MTSSAFNPIPAEAVAGAVTVTISGQVPSGALAVAIPATVDGEVPDSLGIDRDSLTRLGFTGKGGQAQVLPRGEGPDLVAVGVGKADALSLAVLRDAAAVAARAVATDEVVVLSLLEVQDLFEGRELEAAELVSALVEGAILGRYRYDALRSEPTTVQLSELVLLLDPALHEAARIGADRGVILARAGAMSRDLANTPPDYLSAPDLADLATRIGARAGLEVTVHDKAALEEMNCGGLLGVNAGSVVEPRMIVLKYTPRTTPTAHVGLVGKGITYDSGGISLKPSNAMHAAMKMDMTGAGAVLSAMSVLGDLEVPVAVTAYLACTDNMPSGSAVKLGDVLVTRSGRTIEVMNTDAEGRLVMSDAITLANEDNVDAIVDIATLTGACLSALGPGTAGVLGNNDDILTQIEVAAGLTDERVWQLPLDERYRPWLDSEIADIKNIGGEYGGAITAALFLSEWVGDTPWAHLDIAGPMKVEADEAWRTKGATGFGARLLAEFARNFELPAK